MAKDSCHNRFGRAVEEGCTGDEHVSQISTAGTSDHAKFDGQSSDPLASGQAKQRSVAPIGMSWAPASS